MHLNKHLWQPRYLDVPLRKHSIRRTNTGRTPKIKTSGVYSYSENSSPLPHHAASRRRQGRLHSALICGRLPKSTYRHRAQHASPLCCCLICAGLATVSHLLLGTEQLM